ncbi:MAG: DUF3108 domain-containing protein [Kiritimatiellia bacterium]
MRCGALSIFKAAVLIGTLLGGVLARGADDLPGGILRDGERFVYDFRYQKGFMGIPAGTASLSTVATNYRGRAAFALELVLQASPIVEKVYHLTTRFRSLVGPDLEPIAYLKEAEEGTRFYTETAEFVPRAEGGCVVKSRRAFQGGRVQTGNCIREGRVYDLVSVCFHARGKEMAGARVGDRFPVSVASGVTVRDRTILYRGNEMMDVEGGGRVPCQVFVLLADERGKAAEVATFWISRDRHRMPVRIDVSLKFGAVSVRLAEKGRSE